MKLPAAWILMMALAAAPTAHAEPGWVALVVSSHGGVHVTRAGQTIEVHALSKLQAGDQLTIDNGGTATLAFLKGGTRISLQGSLATRVSDTGVDAPGATVAPHAYQASLMPGGANLDRLGGINLRDVAVDPPPMLAYVDAPPVIDAAFLSPVQSLDVEITDPDDHRVVLKIPPGVSHLSLDVATMRKYLDHGHPIQFVRGRQYTLDITALHPTGPPTGAKFTLALVTAEQRKLLEQAVTTAREEVQAHPDDPTPFALVGSLFEASASYQDAVSTMARFALENRRQAEYLQELQAGLMRDLDDANRKAEAAHAAANR